MGSMDFNPRAYVRHDGPPRVLPSVMWNFNPRAYVRHDAKQCMLHLKALFQSTCLREARLFGLRQGRYARNFNPRAYVRHDSGSV